MVGESYGITVWRGTALGKCEVQEISLRHDRFTEPTGARESCNNNSIVGQSLIVENGLYTSELNVTITSDNVGKTITCAYYNVTEITTVGLLNISLTGETTIIIIFIPWTDPEIAIYIQCFIPLDRCRTWQLLPPSCTSSN